MSRPWRLLLIVSLLGWTALATLSAYGSAPVGAETSLDLTSWRGPCGVAITARGTEFAPGLSVRFTIQLEGVANAPANTFATLKTGADGTIEVVADLAKVAPNCPSETQPGSQYRLSALDATTGALLAYALYTIATPTPTSSLTLDPTGGPCTTANPLIVARGGNFFPGAAITLTVRTGATAPVIFPAETVAADGSFASSIRLIGCGPETANGTMFIIAAYDSDPHATPAPLPLIEVTFTVTTTDNGPLCFPATNQCIQGRFLTRWRSSGGLAINGYPLSGEFKQVLEDKKEYTVQYFERVRMEYHPENTAPNDVLLGQFGRRVLATVPSAPTAPASPKNGAIHYPTTGHNVALDFAAYWDANGGLPQFGLPLTEEFTQQLDDGKTYTVQYFERARFERHPENQAPFTILLGQFGRRVLAETGGPR